MSEFHEHTVSEGECISSIAYQYGFFPETIWNLPENADLKELRKDPNILFPGDRILVPEKRIRNESAAADQRHRFRRKGVSEIFRIVLEDLQGGPRSQVSYRAEVDGKTCLEAETEDDGLIEIPVLPNSREVRIYIEPKGGDSAVERDDAEIEQYTFALGTLDPIDETSGVQQRLDNLGYECPLNGEMDDQTMEAIRCFQSDNELEPTGELDENTRHELAARHHDDD